MSSVICFWQIFPSTGDWQWFKSLHLFDEFMLFLCIIQSINLLSFVLKEAVLSILVDSLPPDSHMYHTICQQQTNTPFHSTRSTVMWNSWSTARECQIYKLFLTETSIFKIFSDVLERERSNSLCSQASMSSLWSTQSMDESSTSRQKGVTRQNSYLSAVHSPLSREYSTCLSCHFYVPLLSPLCSTFTWFPSGVACGNNAPGMQDVIYKSHAYTYTALHVPMAVLFFSWCIDGILESYSVYNVQNMWCRSVVYEV